MEQINKILEFINDNYFYLTEEENGETYKVVEFEEIEQFLKNIKGDFENGKRNIKSNKRR